MNFTQLLCCYFRTMGGVSWHGWEADYDLQLFGWGKAGKICWPLSARNRDVGVAEATR